MLTYFHWFVHLLKNYKINVDSKNFTHCLQNYELWKFWQFFPLNFPRSKLRKRCLALRWINQPKIKISLKLSLFSSDLYGPRFHKMKRLETTKKGNSFWLQVLNSYHSFFENRINIKWKNVSLNPKRGPKVSEVLKEIMTFKWLNLFILNVHSPSRKNGVSTFSLLWRK